MQYGKTFGVSFPQERWYAPDGCSIEYKLFEPRIGGRLHCCSHDPVHGDCWIAGAFTESVPKERLVFPMQLSDEAGNLQMAVTAGEPGEWRPETPTSIEAMGSKTNITLFQAVRERRAKQTGAYKSWLQPFAILNRQLTKASNT